MGIKQLKLKDKSPDRNNSRAQALLLAAADILITEGPDKLSARSIAARAKVNKGLLFYYWGNVETLFAEVLEHYYERHKRALEQAFAEEGDLGERMRKLIDAYLDFMEENVAYARIVQQQVSTGGPHLALVSRHLGDVLRMSIEMLEPITDAKGPLSARHFHLTLSAAVINYFTYAPALGPHQWGGDPLCAQALAERREHIHWIVRVWLDALLAKKNQ